MRGFCKNFIPAVAAFALIFSLTASVAGAADDAAELEDLFALLQDPLDGEWQELETRIETLWSRSGSDAMDLLLERGKAAMEAEDYPKAVEHFSALIDHAPGFAEGWNARATAFFLMNEYGLSIADIRQTLRLNPRHFGALAGLGLIYERLEQPDLALRAYLAAMAIHPRRPNLQQAVDRLTDQTEGQSL